MLKENRAARLEQEKTERKRVRRRKLIKILDDRREAEPPLFAMRIPLPEPGSSIESTTSIIEIQHRRPFPLIADLLGYPTIKSLDKTDIPDSEVDARFEENVEAIKVHVLEWRIMLEGHLAGLIREGRVSDGLKEVASPLKLLVEESEPNPFNTLSDDLQLLLRADSLFMSNSGYPLAYDHVFISTILNNSTRRREKPLDLSTFKRHEKAQEVARALLAGIGMPDVSFLELRSNIARLFKCGSCRNKFIRLWEDIVRVLLVARAFTLTLVFADSALR